MIEIDGRFESIINIAFEILDQQRNGRLEMEIDASDGDSWGSTVRTRSRKVRNGPVKPN